VLVVIETCHERQEMEDAEASIRALETNNHDEFGEEDQGE
jgi:hypothetical protein